MARMSTKAMLQLKMKGQKPMSLCNVLRQMQEQIKENEDRC